MPHHDSSATALIDSGHTDTVDGDEAAAPPRRERPRQWPPAPRHVVGATTTLDTLDRVVGSAGHGARGAVQIVGTAGIGTSTVAAFWVHEHRDRFPDGQLYVRMGGSYRTPPSITTVLLRLLQDLGVPASEIPQYDLPTLTRVPVGDGGSGAGHRGG
ncbi:hypothetical protein GCM10029964_092570 [Kibdelosporangium lantanae]